MSNSQSVAEVVRPGVAAQASTPAQAGKPGGLPVKPTGSLIYTVQKGVSIIPTWRKDK